MEGELEQAVHTVHAKQHQCKVDACLDADASVHERYEGDEKVLGAKERERFHDGRKPGELLKPHVDVQPPLQEGTRSKCHTDASLSYGNLVRLQPKSVRLGRKV
jgi:hypothetical protein